MVFVRSAPRKALASSTFSSSSFAAAFLLFLLTAAESHALELLSDQSYSSSYDSKFPKRSLSEIYFAASSTSPPPAPISPNPPPKNGSPLPSPPAKNGTPPPSKQIPAPPPKKSPSSPPPKDKSPPTPFPPPPKTKSPPPPKQTPMPSPKRSPPPPPPKEKIPPTASPSPPKGTSPPKLKSPPPPPKFKPPPQIVRPPPSTGGSRNLGEVCSALTAQSYQTSCSSSSTQRSLNTIKQYLSEAAKLEVPICSCEASVAAALLRSCPSISSSAAYIGSCDTQCGYGIACPFQSRMFALISTTPQSTGDKIATAVAHLGFQATVGSGPTLCFRLIPGLNMKPITGARILRLSDRAVVLPLFDSSNIPGALAACPFVASPLVQRISLSPSQYAVQIDTSDGKGLAEAPIVTSVHLYALFDFREKSRKATYFFDITFLGSSIQFSIKVVGGQVSDFASASIGTGKASSGSTTVPLFGANGNKPAERGGISSTLDAVDALLGNVQSLVVSVTFQDSGGSSKVALSDTLSVKSTLLASNVLPLSTWTASASFVATVGAGQLCFSFITSGDLGTVTQVNLHKGFKGEVSDVMKALLVKNAFVKEGCIDFFNDDLSTILSSPSGYYVQIVSLESPFGVLRGQLEY